MGQDREVDVSRRDLGALLGILGGAAGFATFASCSSAAETPESTSSVDPTAQAHQAISGSGFLWVDTVVGPSGSLRTISGSDIAGGNPVAVVGGYASANDGGGGVFYWSTIAATDDGGSIIVPVSGGDGGAGSAGACWIRLGAYNPLKMRYTSAINVRWYGAVGNGVDDDTNAVNRAIAALLGANPANSQSYYVYQAIYFPAGVYYIGSAPTGDAGTSTSALTAITSSSTYLIGDGPDASLIAGASGQTLIAFGSTASGYGPTIGGGMRDIGIYYGTTPTNSVGISINNASQLDFRNMSITNAWILAQIGSSGYAASSGGVTFSHIRGYVHYTSADPSGPPCVFNLIGGGGFWGDNITIAVGAGGSDSPAFPAPGSTTAATGAAGLLPAEGTNPASPTGINFMNIIPPASRWDTVVLSNCLVQQFTAGIYMYVGVSSAIEFVQVSNCTFDNCGQYGLFASMASGGGSISNIQLSNCIFTGWDAVGIYLKEQVLGQGYIDNVSVSNCLVHDTWSEGILLGGQTRQTTLTGCNVVRANRARGYYAAIHATTYATGFAITGCVADKDVVDAGANQAAYGINIEDNCDSYSVTGNTFTGGSASSKIGSDTLNSLARLITGNSATPAYSGVQTGASWVQPGPASAGTFTWQNYTPFRVQVYVSGCTSFAKGVAGSGGSALLATTATILLDPGETYTVGWPSGTTAPTVNYFISA